MPPCQLSLTISLIAAAAAPLSAASEVRNVGGAAAPPGTAETRYCMRVEAMTGSRIEAVRCWTRRY